MAYVSRVCAIAFGFLLLSFAVQAQSVNEAPQLLQVLQHGEGESVQTALSDTLILWEHVQPIDEVQVGELVWFAWLVSPKIVTDWFSAHSAEWQHWVEIQDYLFLSLTSMHDPAEVVKSKDALLVELKALGRTKPLAREYAAILEHIDFML